MKHDYLGIAIYKGDFKFGKPDGEGHLKWTDNPRMYKHEGALEYQGAFEAGRPHGEGKMLMKSGKVMKDIFSEGLARLTTVSEEFGGILNKNNPRYSGK